jgi:hypothetical protein
LSELAAPVLVSAVLLTGAAAVLVVLLRRRRTDRRAAPPGATGHALPPRATPSRPRPHTEREREAPRRSERSPVRPLAPETRQRFVTAWERALSRRADRPVLTLSEADTIVERLLVECGYPLDDPRPAAQVLSAEQARVLDSYRAGHALEQANSTTSSDPQQVALGLRHLSVAFEGLVGGGVPRTSRASSRRSTSAPTG